MMDILLIGDPGSGKGTQAKKLRDNKKFVHLSTGDLFRKNLKEATNLGTQAQHYIKKGLLVPDKVTIDMVEDFLKNVAPNQSIIFDGFPRNLDQAQALDQILQKNKRKIHKAIYFDISDDEVVERLKGRLWARKSGRIYHIRNNPPKREGICDETGEVLVTRCDDKEELIRHRLKVFHENTTALIQYYSKKGFLKSVSAVLSPEQLFTQISLLLEKS